MMDDRYNNGWGMNGTMGSGAWVLMGLMLGLLLLLLVAVVFSMTTRHAHAAPAAPMVPVGPGRSGGSAAQLTLDGRYARGEIDDDEYLRRRSFLTEGEASGPP